MLHTLGTSVFRQPSRLPKNAGSQIREPALFDRLPALLIAGMTVSFCLNLLTVPCFNRSDAHRLQHPVQKALGAWDVGLVQMLDDDRHIGMILGQQLHV